MKERIIYECEHCNKKRLINKTQMKNHEDMCWYNLKNKTCLTCEYFEYRSVQYEPKYCNLKERIIFGNIEVKCSLWREKEEI